MELLSLRYIDVAGEEHTDYKLIEEFSFSQANTFMGEVAERVGGIRAVTAYGCTTVSLKQIETALSFFTKIAGIVAMYHVGPLATALDIWTTLQPHANEWSKECDKGLHMNAVVPFARAG